MNLASPRRAFAGWQQVAVAFVTLFVSVGFGFYSYGAFFPALADEFGGSRLGVGIGMSIFFLTNGLLSPFLGRAIENGSIRRVLLLGVAFLVAGLVAASRVQDLWQFYCVLGGLLAVGACLLGGLTGSTLVSNWFVRRRGMALGVATMGISFSGMVMAPLATWLIELYGWRNTFLAYAGLTIVVVLPAVYLLVIDRPEDIGQTAGWRSAAAWKGSSESGGSMPCARAPARLPARSQLLGDRSGDGSQLSRQRGHSHPCHSARPRPRLLGSAFGAALVGDCGCRCARQRSIFRLGQRPRRPASLRCGWRLDARPWRLSDSYLFQDYPRLVGGGSGLRSRHGRNGPVVGSFDRCRVRSSGLSDASWG